MKIRVKRIYDAPAKSDGARILVDRLWPRGISKRRAQIAAWIKEATPSNELRQWFHADPDARWKLFQRKYRNELRRNATELKKRFAAFKQPITLLTSVKDPEKSHVSVLRKFLS